MMPATSVRAATMLITTQPGRGAQPAAGDMIAKPDRTTAT
jgi:hypothetical protein